MQENNAVVSLYVVKSKNGNFFKGFDAGLGKSTFVADLLEAKKFTNKYDIKLRPQEYLVEITIDLSKSVHTISEPFRPNRRVLPDGKISD